MKKRGFTLVELLAVIILLAIISVIIVPTIMKSINDSKEETTIISAKKYVNAVKLALTDRGIENNSTLTHCEVQSDGNIKCDNEEIVEIDLKGDKPKSGTLEISSYTVTSAEDLTFKNGTVSTYDGVTYEYTK